MVGPVDRVADREIDRDPPNLIDLSSTLIQAGNHTPQLLPPPKRAGGVGQIPMVPSRSGQQPDGQGDPPSHVISPPPLTP